MAVNKVNRTAKKKLADCERVAETAKDKPAQEGEPDAVAIFYLLYPMLSDCGKQSSEAMKALRIVSKYLPAKTVRFMWKCVGQKPPLRVSGRQSARSVNSV